MITNYCKSNNKRISLLLIIAFIAFLGTIVPYALAGQGAGGAGSGGGQGGIIGDGTYSRTWIWFDEGGFSGSNREPTQGWNEDSKAYFKKLLTDRTEAATGLPFRWEDGLNGDGIYFKDRFDSVCDKALENARNRAGTSRSRLVGIGWSFGALQGKWSGFARNLTVTTTYYDLIQQRGEEDDTGNGCLSSTYGWDNTVHRGDQYDGQSWRDYVWHCGADDNAGLNDAILVAVAVADNEPTALGSIEVSKTDSNTGQVVPEAGFKFTLLDSNQSAIDTKETDGTGKVKFEKLQYGTYYIKEESVNKPYIVNSDLKQVIVDDNNVDVTISVPNKIAYGSVKVTKTDSVLKCGIPGTKFDVIANENIDRYSGNNIYSENQVIETITTNDDGIAASTVPLYIGADGDGRYKLVETSVPIGVTLKRDPILFTLTYKNPNVEFVGTASLNQVNDIAYGSAVISKYDNVINSAVPYAEYDVIATEDIALWNGHRIYKKDQIVDHVITGQDGKARTYARLYVGSDGDGKYKFVETNVKAPLIINKTPIPFTITYKDENTEVLDTQQVKQTNDVPYAPAEITKTDNVLNSGVPGVEYDIKAVENINLWNGKIYTKNQVIGHVTTDSNGVAKTDDSIKLYPSMTGIGRYAFIETKVPVGLTIDSTPIEFTVRYKNQEDSSLSTQRVSQADAVVYGGASIRKTETTNGTNISGAKFNVVADEDIVLWNGKTIYRKDDIVDQVTSNSDGVATTSKPLYVGSFGVGHYRFVETFTPCPYFNDRVDVPFTVNYVDNKTENVRIEKSAQKEKGNDIQRREVHFSKTDFSSGAPVAGAVFELSANEDVRTQSGSVVYRKDEVIGTYTTDEDGFIYVKDGKILVDASGECSYKFVEVKAPAGYVLDSTPANFTVKYVGQNVDVQYGDDISVMNKPNELKLTKTVTPKGIDSGVTDTTVPNATYRVWRKSDELPVSVDDNSDSYALRIDNGNTDNDVSVIMKTGINTLARIVLSKDSAVDYSVILTDEKGNVTSINNTAAENTTLAAGKYTVSLVDSNGVTITQFDGDKSIELKNGKKVTFAVTIDENNNVKVITTIDNADDIAANVEKKSGAYIATGLKLNTEYQVEIDDDAVYTFTTSDKGGKVYYGRYDSKASDYAYKRQPMLLTDDSKFIDKFTVNGKDYPIQTKVDTDGNISFTHITPGSYGIGETDVPSLVDELPGSSESYLVNTGVCYFTVDETTGRINDVNDFRTSSEDDYTVVTLSKVEITGGPEIPGAQLEVQKPNGDVVDSWTSTDKPHIISRLMPGKYSLVERMTPNRYDQASKVDFVVKDTGEVQHVEMIDNPIRIHARIDKRQEIAQPVADLTVANGDGQNRAAVRESGDGSFAYSLDYCNDSSTWVDEFTVYDSLECVSDGLARLDGVVTARCFEDFDGLMNVWYRTNMTSADYSDDVSKANATLSDGHENPWIVGVTRGDAIKSVDSDNDSRVLSYSGWKLWKSDISTSSADELSVSDLGLSDGEYVTGLRFEYGRVEAGFTTRTSAWNRNDLKDVHDDVDEIEYVHTNTFIVTTQSNNNSNQNNNSNNNDKSASVDGEKVTMQYAPAIINMHVTYDYQGDATLRNSAYVDTYRNGGGDNNLEWHDNDYVEQKTAPIVSAKNDEVANDLVQTGLSIRETILFACFILCSAILEFVIFRRRM